MATRKALVVLVLVAACSKRNALPPEAWGVDDYAKAGIRIDKPWLADDYTAMAKLIGEVTADHRERLPRYHGARSGEVFDKLVAAAAEQASQPVGPRFAEEFAHFEALNVMFRLYLPSMLDTPPREAVEISGALMRDAVGLLGDSDAMIASFGPDDPKHEVRVAGQARMYTGFGGILLGGVIVAADRRVPDDDRVAMLHYVTAALPTLFPHVLAETQGKVRDLLATEVEEFPAGKLRDAAVAAQQALPK